MPEYREVGVSKAFEGSLKRELKPSTDFISFLVMEYLKF
jgi:hypothetical protein